MKKRTYIFLVFILLFLSACNGEKETRFLPKEPVVHQYEMTFEKEKIHQYMVYKYTKEGMSVVMDEYDSVISVYEENEEGLFIYEPTELLEQQVITKEAFEEKKDSDRYHYHTMRASIENEQVVYAKTLKIEEVMNNINHYKVGKQREKIVSYPIQEGEVIKNQFMGEITVKSYKNSILHLELSNGGEMKLKKGGGFVEISEKTTGMRAVKIKELKIEDLQKKK